MARRISPDQQSRFVTFRKRLSSSFTTVRKYATYSHTTSFIQRHPFWSFFLALLLLFLVIMLGNTIFKAKPVEEKKADLPKQVEIYKLGSAPRISVQAEVEKSGVVKIVALMPGIVSSINVSEGDGVTKGKQLVSLSSNYQGGNVLSLSRQIAQNQYNSSEQTYPTQKELIEKQREIARKTDANADELRDISARSIDETRSSLDFNQGLLDSTDAQITSLEAISAPTTDQLSALAQAKAAKAQLLGAVNQLRSALRNTEYGASGDTPPSQLSDLGREIALKQLEVQEKSLEAGRQIAKLQYKLAAVSEAQMYPAAPFGGVVERVHVRIGQQVNPGTVLVTLSGNEKNVTLVASVPKETAFNVSLLEQSSVEIGNSFMGLTPAYISQEATQGQLYSVIYHVGDEYAEQFTDSSFVKMSLPIGTARTSGIAPIIPVDSVFQTQQEAYVYVMENGIARSKKVTLGDVQGSYVGIQDGLGSEDQVILSRTVVDGDHVVEAL